MKIKKLNLLIILVVALLFWLAINKVSFTMKLKDNPGWVTGTGDLLNPKGVDSMVIVPLRDGINTMIPTPSRPYYLRGENNGKLHVEMVCYAADGSVFNQFKTVIPANKINATGNQKIKIDPPLNCKGRETTVKFTATGFQTVASLEEYLSIHVDDVHLPFYYNKVFLKDILKEINQKLADDNKFRMLYYSFVGLSLFLIIIFSLLETKKKE